jgi:hypothetical protein
MRVGIYLCTQWLAIERTGMSNRRDWPKTTRRLLMEAWRVENFPFMVLFLLAAISLVSRIWLMLR